MQKSYLITGGSGFIGGHLVKDLLKDTSTGSVMILDLRPYPGAPDPRLSWVQADIRKPLNLELKTLVDTCYHLAAVCREPGYPKQEYFDANHIGTKNVIDLVKKNSIPEIIFTSTIMVYPAGDLRCDEKSVLLPNTAYGSSKVLAEGELIKWSEGGGRLRIVRPGVVFGPGDYGNYILMYHALKKGLFCYIGRKTTVKGSIYVKDLVACLRFMETGKARGVLYNGVFPKASTIGDIVTAICRAKNWRRFVPVLPYRTTRAMAYLGSFLNVIGVRNGIHPRRIDKLYFSTDVSADALIKDGFAFSYDLTAAISDWVIESNHGDLH